MTAPSVDLAQSGGSGGRSPAARSHQRSAFRSRLTHYDMKYMPYVFIAPFFVLFLTFAMFPLGYNVWTSFQRYRLLDSPNPSFTGWSNYQRLWGDSDFWHSVLVTFGLFIFSSGPQLVLALCLASVLNRRLKAQTFFRMGILVPYITPLTASTFVFKNLLARDNGLVNLVLTHLGFSRIDWVANDTASWVALCSMIDWKWTGYNTLIYLAAMQAIPKDLYEAATVDGAGPWRQFWRLTVPLIRPTVLFTVIMSTIGGLQLFTEPILFDNNVSAAQGGSTHAFRTVQMYIYNFAWGEKLNLGYAGAMSVVLFLIIMLVVLVNVLVTSRLGGRK